MTTRSIVFFIVSSLGLSASSIAATAPSLGMADSFAVLAGEEVNNADTTIISGDLGIYPRATLIGFPPAMVTNGDIYLADPLSDQAQRDAADAATQLATQPSDFRLSGKDLGGMVLNSGVYAFGSCAKLHGVLTLDAKKDPNAVFIFQVNGPFTVADHSSIKMINGGRNSNVFFLVGTSVFVGPGSSIIGNVIANLNVTLHRGVTVSGKILSLMGTVSLNKNEITIVAAPTPTPIPR